MDPTDPTSDDAATGPDPTPGSESPVTDAPASGQPRPVDLRDYVDFSPTAARRTRVFATSRLAHDLWCIEPQQATPVLQFPDVDVTYTVIGGRSWFVTEEGEIGLDPLGALLVPAGVVHGIDNRGADPLIISATSAPADGEGEDAPVTTDGEAVRDDAKYGQARRRLGEAFGRLLGR